MSCVWAVWNCIMRSCTRTKIVSKIYYWFYPSPITFHTAYKTAALRKRIFLGNESLQKRERTEGLTRILSKLKSLFSFVFIRNAFRIRAFWFSFITAQYNFNATRTMHLESNIDRSDGESRVRCLYFVIYWLNFRFSFELIRTASMSSVHIGTVDCHVTAIAVHCSVFTCW